MFHVASADFAIVGILETCMKSIDFHGHLGVSTRMVVSSFPAWSLTSTYQRLLIYSGKATNVVLGSEDDKQDVEY